MSKLLESDFLSVNLSNVISRQKSAADIKPIDQSNKIAVADEERDLSSISDWSKELEDRLTKNSALPAEQRKSVYDIELQFFTDYFTYGNTSWKADCTNLLLALGAPLRKVIKELGFDENTNPILGFVTNSHVVNNLLRTKLLNTNTFKAIYNAIAKRLVAHTEFLHTNDYNIIYCQDLYKRSASEIEKYLTIQKNILKPSASVYTLADQKKNKKVFFYIKNIKELNIDKRKEAIVNLPANKKLPRATDPATKLNEYNLAVALSGASVDSSNKNNNSKINASTNKAQAVSRKLNNKAQFFAAIQYISLNNDIAEAAQALGHKKFETLSAIEVAKASTAIEPLMKAAKLSEAEAKELISLLMDQ